MHCENEHYVIHRYTVTGVAFTKTVATQVLRPMQVCISEMSKTGQGGSIVPHTAWIHL